MMLTLHAEAQREIQKDVDALTESQRYFNIKVERAKTYFPVIEKIFAEERVPDDFKYLVLQESALIANAVSVSNAVGFWQFKDFTAREVGLHINDEVDERMNIVAATRGAARYLKQNNFMFNNWLFALQAYQMGAGGVKRLIGDEYNGVRHMHITTDTYWYVKKFLAHKIAFQHALSGAPQVQVEIRQASGQQLQALADAAHVDVEQLKAFNMWVKGNRIPADKTYAVVVPAGRPFIEAPIVARQQGAPTVQPAEVQPQLVRAHGLAVVVAQPNETPATLSERAGINLSDFLKYNDIPIDHRVEAGKDYLLQRKKTRSEQNFYTVGPGETAWHASQQTGVQLRKIRKYNNLESDVVPAGTQLWLNTYKPVEVPLGSAPVAVLDDEEITDWFLSAVEPSHPSETDKKRPLPVGVLPVGEPAGTEASDAPVRWHTVLAGDTYSSVARQYQITLATLLALNQRTGHETLKPGDTLKVDGNEPITLLTEQQPATDTTVHQVQASDTLFSVARKYGITIKDLMEWNNKTDFSLAVGERLRVAPR